MQMNRYPWIFLFVHFLIGNVLGQKPSTGLVPINDLAAAEYRGFQGGLYPNGSNSRPWKHDSLGMVFSREIRPLDVSGNMDTLKGKVVLLSIGMSNTTQEFSLFKQTADTFRWKNPKLILVDGAVGGQTAAIISDPNRNPNYWNTVDQRLQSAGLGAKQVQICWIKEADANPTQSFPSHANTLMNELAEVARIIKRRFINCKVSYWSSRTYGGYATTTLNPEPYAYESGFSVKGLIERQINGDTSLTCNGQNPNAPWLAWGPYLWADGQIPRSDGLNWSVTDFATSDGTHPSASGRKKVADLLLAFFKTDLTAKDWFLKNTFTDVHAATILKNRDGFMLQQNYPNPFNPSTTVHFNLPEGAQAKLAVLDASGREVAILVDRVLPAGEHEVVFRTYVLPSGLYLFKFQTDACIQIKKGLLIR